MLNITDYNRVINQLKQFGCNSTEASIYIQSLKMGPSTVQEIAVKLNLNRVNVHNGINQLIQKALMYETRKGKRRFVGAESPENLFQLIQTKYNEIKLQETNLQYVAKLLQGIQSVDRSVPTVKFYEGVDGFKKMLEETLSAKNGVRVLTYVDIFAELLSPEYLENYFERRAGKGISTKLIFPPCDFASRVNKKAKDYKIEVRLLPPQLKWKSGFFNWNNKVALMSYTENRLTCTIIENEDIAYFFRNIIFDLLWPQSTIIAE